ncbi:glycosyltransferase family 4 protein [Neobacillus sp. PS2-9]|uniref:glycosyltransferase family 4 protein n=1 Tax=Neobacillus sp. PS2-9 TaxID=3070676 RepID=UPI0027DF63F6|nr:glycosyltransferase family 4 protein [Neobacillus sp. PS2-9]WML59309.1 glycosyltransferase family 4 protein [Neobacillus sp. PS2-9]
MVKILYVATISNMINAFLIPHIKVLVEQGNEVGLAFNEDKEINPELIKLGCKIHHVKFQRNPFNKNNFYALKEIKKIISTEGYKLVHVHAPVASLITRWACKNMSEVTMLYTAHGFHFFKGAPKINWVIYYSLEKIAAKWTDGIITMNDEDFSSAKKLKLRKRNSVYKVHGIGLNLTRFKPSNPKEKSTLRKENDYNLEDFIIINVGELCYRKHQDLLIQAVSIVSKKIKNIKLLLVGEGDQLSNYKQLVQTLELENHVDFLGYRQDINALMSISDLAVSTSRQEGLPVNVMEAMAVGLPIIVTDCRGNRDLISNDVNGIVVGDNDSLACANAIEKLYNSQELREKFADKNKELIQTYSIENVITEMEQIYSNIMINKESKLINKIKKEQYSQQGSQN